MRRLINYNQNINYFLQEETAQTLGITFDLDKEEVVILKEILGVYYESFSRLDRPARYKDNKDLMKDLKKVCEADWNSYMSGRHHFSKLNGEFIRRIDTSSRPAYMKQNIIHSVTRIGEFYYLTDDEMEGLATDIDKFIEAGDCCLFAHDGPYKDIPLSTKLEEDLVDKAPIIKEYIRENSHSPHLNPEDILQALEKVKLWMTENSLDEVPEWVRGFIQICQEIKRECLSMKEEDFSDGIPESLLMTKRSGFCLNKEIWFREFCQKYNLPSWKNPEGSYLYGVKNYPFSSNFTKDMRGITDWDMNRIYYSTGKGPWWKVRYVGQPPAHYQNLAEYGACIIKRVIKEHSSRRTAGKRDPWKRELEDISLINIYNNYSELKDLVLGMTDGYAQDFSAYSDYLNRNIFEWIMRYLWGMPKWFRNIINHLMSIPVSINGKDYHYLHGSVMGIKLNFLLITFANALMWVISNIISNTSDKAKFMGDDFLSVKREGYYSEEEKEIRYEVCSYFNCVINRSKTETLSEQGYVSFCKRYFNKEGIQITGLGGEYFMKMKPFLNDISVWENVCYHNDIPIRREQVNRMIELWSPYMSVSYNRFYRKGDPSLGEMASILKKIPFYYGGWSLEEADQELEKILLQSVVATVQVIFEDVFEDLSSSSLNKIREFLRLDMEDYKSNRYYNILDRSSSYSEDYDRIRRHIDDVMDVLEKQSYDIEEMKRARYSAQRLMEIVLQRDSKLANSSSTKNRIAYNFDQDRVSKIRYGYFQESLSGEEDYLQSSIIDHAVLKDNMNDKDLSDAIKDYMRYIHAKNRSRSIVKTYWDAACHGYLAMQVFRKNEDGSEKELKKRITIQDSSYDHAYYSEGRWHGQFVNKWDLTEDERLVFDYLSNKNTKMMIDHMETILDSQITNMTSYLLNRLVELME